MFKIILSSFLVNRIFSFVCNGKNMSMKTYIIETLVLK